MIQVKNEKLEKCKVELKQICSCSGIRSVGIQSLKIKLNLQQCCRTGGDSSDFHLYLRDVGVYVGYVKYNLDFQ